MEATNQQSIVLFPRMVVKSAHRNLDDASGDPLASKSRARWEPSQFVARIMQIAEEQDDYITNDTLRELEEQLKPVASSRIAPTRSLNDVVVAKTCQRTTGLRIHITQDQLDTAKTVADVVGKMAQVGKFIFSKNEKLLKYLGPIGTAAGVLKDVIELFEEEKPDLVMQAFGELSNQLTTLSNKMTSQFDDLKSFVVEHDFYGSYTVAMSSLNKFMIDTINVKTRESVQVFKKVHADNLPQKLVYDLLSQLEISANNPLKVAMKSGDVVQSKATFEKWKELLESVLSQALFLETFAMGLLGVSNHGQTMILEKMALYFDLVKQWEQYYLTTADYWPQGVQSLIDDVHENQKSVSEYEKSSWLMKKLNAILTNDKFYVVVFGDHIWANHAPKSDQLIKSFRNDTNIIVYRSKATDLDRLYSMQGYWHNNLLDSSQKKFGFANHWSIVRHWADKLRDNSLAKIASDQPGFGLYMMVAQSGERIGCDSSTVNADFGGPGFHSYRGTLKTSDGFSSDQFEVFWLFAQ